MAEEGLARIFRALPLLPQSEYVDDQERQGFVIRQLKKKRARLHEDWRTGELDYELVQRVESLKTSALSSGGPSTGRLQLRSNG